jgi:serine/threonine-protein kinase
MSEAAALSAYDVRASSLGFSSSGAGASLPLPRVLGRLLLLKLLARGGMGDVYLAATTGIEGAERACVVKTVRRDHIHDGSFLARFLDEARVQAQLNHPGVAQVLEAATDENGEPFTVVEYVEGRSLADVRHRAVQLGVKFGWPEAVCIAIEIAQALAHVHERADVDGSPLGIVHRDLSPQNVMIGFAGEVKLIDFGTARGHNRRCHTVAGVVFAKPGYVAPEVARQQAGDGRIDIYALGIMLWEMCKGGRFLAGDAQKHLEDSANGTTVVPRIAARGGAPFALDDLIGKLTANDPKDRYATGSHAANDLARLLAQAPSGEAGERSVRGRVGALMKALWPKEPSHSRADFARFLRDARALVADVQTPTSAKSGELAARHSSDPDMLAGTPYRVGAKLGEGSSATVYEAEHVELGRKVALKVLSPAYASAHDAIDRFRREARVVARLSHPNLVALHDFGRSLDGRVFLAMELLAGETLDKRMKRLGGMDWREAARLGIEVCVALDVAHRAGLVHRDLKPANLFLTQSGGIKLLDFGVAMALADVAADASEKRQKGFAVFGTPEYMAPEQVAGEAVDARCDVYALGAVLYELATGTRVFDGASSVVVLGKQLREDPEPPRVRAPRRGISEGLDRAIVRALDKSPEGRFASAAAMREALEDALRAPQKSRSRARKRAFAIAVGAVVVAAIATLGRIERSRLLPLGVTAGAQVTRTFESEATLALPLPAPPTATPDLTAAPPPPPESSASSVSLPRASLAPLPPLPVAKSGSALADTAHTATGKDTKPDPEHVRKGHGHSLATVEGIETVMHKTHR